MVRMSAASSPGAAIRSQPSCRGRLRHAGRGSDGGTARGRPRHLPDPELVERNPTVEAVQDAHAFRRAARACLGGDALLRGGPTRRRSSCACSCRHGPRPRGKRRAWARSIECTYEGGYLEATITSSDPPSSVRVDVIKQELGVEGTAFESQGARTRSARTGRAVQRRADDELLRAPSPALALAPAGALLAHGLHRHILDGMRVTMDASARARDDRALPAAQG